MAVILGWGRTARRVADGIAAAFAGRVEPCLMTFTLRPARYCVKATYGGRRLEIYVFPPWCEVWVQDVRLRSDDLTVAVGLPRPALGLTEPVAPASGSPEAPRLFWNAASDGQAIQQFLLVRLDVSDGTLGLPPVAGGFLPVVYCLACQPAGPTTVAFEGDRWVLKEEGPGQFQPPATELAERPLAVRHVDDRTGLPPFVARVGGEPDWIQAAETPDCPGCGGPTPFLLQLPTDPAADVHFGDDGVLYAFFCARCAMVTTLTQSH